LLNLLQHNRTPWLVSFSKKLDIKNVACHVCLK
jgi:hypothetical protein